MSSSAQRLPPESANALPTGPSPETWAAMSPGDRERFIEQATSALNQQAELMAEGRRHGRARMSITQMVEDYFQRAGRQVYVASDLPVVYPYEDVFAPDLMVVLDVEDPRDQDTRTAWIVSQEGRGLDLALEITHLGDRQKDMAENVVDYARLGIPEYFIYDPLRQQVLGYRLPASGARRYQPIPSRGGLLKSQVLGLDLAIAEGKLRFFSSGALVPEAHELLDRVNAMLDERQERLAEAERRLAEAERRLAEEIGARAALEAKVAELLARLGEG